MMNNEIKMVALSDDALECVVGGFDVEQEIIEPAKGAGMMFVMVVERIPDLLISPFTFLFK